MELSQFNRAKRREEEATKNLLSYKKKCAKKLYTDNWDNYALEA